MSIDRFTRFGVTYKAVDADDDRGCADCAFKTDLNFDCYSTDRPSCFATERESGKEIVWVKENCAETIKSGSDE